MYDFTKANAEAKNAAQSHWETAKQAENLANSLAKQVKELEDKIQSLQNSVLPLSPSEDKKVIAQKVKQLQENQKTAQLEEQQHRSIAKQEQAKGDNIYGSVYNLDRKNPQAASDFEHLPPERLIADIMAKDARIGAIMAEIKDILGEKI